MKLCLYDEIALALDTRKKNGEAVFDQNNLEVKVAGTFAGDKFIVIKHKEARVESNPDPELKQHHPYEPVRLHQGDQREEECTPPV
jgi:hypothetical protein